MNAPVAAVFITSGMSLPVHAQATSKEIAFGAYFLPAQT
jgi:hypothetical protein